MAPHLSNHQQSMARDGRQKWYKNMFLLTVLPLVGLIFGALMKGAAIIQAPDRVIMLEQADRVLERRQQAIELDVAVIKATVLQSSKVLDRLEKKADDSK